MTATQLTFVVDATIVDPDAEHRARIRKAIHAVAVMYGHVSPNRVRRLLAGFVPPHLVGQEYRNLRREGHLVPLGWETSDDVRGGNAGKPARTYTWVEQP